MKKLLVCLIIFSSLITGCNSNEKEVGVLNYEINALNIANTTKDIEINNLKEKIKDNESVIDELNKEIEDKNIKIEELQERINEFKQQTSSEENNYTPKYGITEDGRIFGISDKHYNPIIVSRRGAFAGKFVGGKILGGSVNGKWIAVEDFVLPEEKSVYRLNDYDIDLVKGGEEFKMYSLTSYITTVTADKPSYYYVPSSVTHGIVSGFNESFEADGDLTVGVSSDWNALPRIPSLLEEVYGYSIDLDNDGVDEKITVEPHPEDSGRVNYYLKKEGEDDIIFGTSYPIGDWVTWRELIFADLNGDGIIEIIASEQGHNTSIGIYEYNGKTVDHVLGYYAGD